MELGQTLFRTIQRIISVTRSPKFNPTLTKQPWYCAAPSPIPHPHKDQPLSEFWAALADAKEERIGSTTFLKLGRGVKFPHEGGVTKRLFVRDCYKHFQKQAIDYCEQLVDEENEDGSIGRVSIDSPVFILRGSPGKSLFCVLFKSLHGMEILEF